MSGKYFYKGINITELLNDVGTSSEQSNYKNFPNFTSSGSGPSSSGNAYQDIFQKGTTNLLANKLLKSVTISATSSGELSSVLGGNPYNIGGDSNKPKWTHFKFTLKTTKGDTGDQGSSIRVPSEAMTRQYVLSNPRGWTAASQQIGIVHMQQLVGSIAETTAAPGNWEAAHHNRHRRARHRRKDQNQWNINNTLQSIVHLGNTNDNVYTTLNNYVTTHTDNENYDGIGGVSQAIPRAAPGSGGNGVIIESVDEKPINITNNKTIYIKNINKYDNTSTAVDNRLSFIYVTDKDFENNEFPYFIVGGTCGCKGGTGTGPVFAGNENLTVNNATYGQLHAGMQNTLVVHNKNFDEHGWDDGSQDRHNIDNYRLFIAQVTHVGEEGSTGASGSVITSSGGAGSYNFPGKDATSNDGDNIFTTGFSTGDDKNQNYCHRTFYQESLIYHG